MPFIGNSYGIYTGGTSYFTTGYNNWVGGTTTAAPRKRTEYTEDIEGTKTYYNARGQIHRDREPAIIAINGNRWWYQFDLEHREDGPSFEAISGNRHWKQRGKFHRLHGPALEYVDGTKEWWFNGKRHREDGPAIERAYGVKEWWHQGRRLLVSSTDEAMRFLHADKYL